MLAAIAHCGNRQDLARLSGVSWTHISKTAAGELRLGRHAAERLVAAQSSFPALSHGYENPVPFPDASLEDWLRGYMLPSEAAA